MSARLVRAAFETLEHRRHLSVVTLNNGYEDGAMSVGVDAYGAFGISVVGEPLQYGDRRPGGLGEISKSYTLFSPARAFLTSGSETLVDPNGFTFFDPTTGNPSVPGFVGAYDLISFESATDTSAVSKFTLSGTDTNGKTYKYDVKLTQTLSSVQPTDRSRYVAANGDPQQSTLTQTYEITEALGVDSSFSLSRYIEPRDNVLSGGPDFSGTNAALDGGRTLAVGGIASGNFIQVSSYGGTFNTAAINRQGLDAAVIRNNGVVGAGGVIGDSGNGLAKLTPTVPGTFTNGFTTAIGTAATTNFYAGLAHQFDFVLGGRQSTSFTTTTTLGQNIPIQLSDLIRREQEIVFPTSTNAFVPTTVAGDFAFSASTYNYNLPSAGSPNPGIQVTINRLGGTSGTASVSVGLVSFEGGTPTGSIAVQGTVDFLDGQNSVTIPLTVATGASTANTSFQLTLGTTNPGSNVIGPSTATVNVNPVAPAFAPEATTYSTSSRQSELVIPIKRTGNLNGVASVLVTTANGTATAGVDYTAVNTRIDFADGQDSATVTIPILKGTQDNSNQTFTVTLTGTTPNASGSGETSVVTNSVVTVTRAALDVTAPFVTAISTSAGRRGIDSIFITFSEPLRGPGDLSVYSVLARSAEGASGSARTKAVALSSVSYDNNTRTVRVAPRTALPFNKNFQITVRPGVSLTDATGNTINQNPGVSAAYVAYFSRGNKVSYVDRTGDTVQLTMKNGTFELIRESNGEGATARLFGSGVTTSLFSGRVRASRNGAGTTTRFLIADTSQAAISLPGDQFISTPG